MLACLSRSPTTRLQPALTALPQARADTEMEDRKEAA